MVAITDATLEALRVRWTAERPLYESYQQYIERCLNAEAMQRGLSCRIEVRTKEIKEFLKKALRKNYASPYDDIRDKVGGRVVVTYEEDLRTAEEFVNRRFRIVSREDKTLTLEYDKLGYLGIHLEVEPLAEYLSTDTMRFSGLVCEIQLRTKAQDLWATISHMLAYKPAQDTPPDVMRRIYRLAALVELFDDQVSGVRGTIMSQPGYQEAQLLDQLERHYYRLTAKTYDRALSLDVIEKLGDLLSAEDVRRFDNLMAAFVERNANKLDMIYRDYRDDDRSVTLFLFQPESLLIWERLEHDAFRLKDTWVRTLPLQLLEYLATIWGRSV